MSPAPRAACLVHCTLLLAAVTGVWSLEFSYNGPAQDRNALELLEPSSPSQNGLGRLLCVSRNCKDVSRSERFDCLYRTCFGPPDESPDVDPISAVGMKRSSLLQLPQRPSKRWQYSDPLQACIASHCQGLQGVGFYQCVYTKCIEGKER